MHMNMYVQIYVCVCMHIHRHLLLGGEGRRRRVAGSRQRVIRHVGAPARGRLRCQRILCVCERVCVCMQVCTRVCVCVRACVYGSVGLYVRTRTHDTVLTPPMRLDRQ